MLPDLWTTCDLPLLAELVRRLEIEGESNVRTPVPVDGLEPAQVDAALHRLDRHGYIKGAASLQSRGPAVVMGVHEKGLRAVGVWPSPEQLVDRLLAALAEAAEHAGTAEERSCARRALEALRSAGRDVLVNAAGGALGSAVV